jgi:hypothetical protein
VQVVLLQPQGLDHVVQLWACTYTKGGPLHAHTNMGTDEDPQTQHSTHLAERAVAAGLHHYPEGQAGDHERERLLLALLQPAGGGCR